MTFLKFLLFLLILRISITFEEQHSRDQRIFIGDTGFFEARVAQLESMVQQQAAKNAQLESKVKVLETKVQEQNSTIRRLEKQRSSTGGATFVHWGSRSCPNATADLVYSGFAAGGFYGHDGAGVNYLCLPRDPIYGNRTIMPEYYNYMYGAIYETSFWGINAQGEGAPCAVCMSNAGSSTLMIPGRNTCHQGWTRHYHGYLASSYYIQKAQRDYACIDERAEFLIQEQRGAPGAIFYPVLSTCTPLPCPPYQDHLPMTCAVCSK